MRVISFMDLITRVKREIITRVKRDVHSLYNPQFDGFIFTMFEDDEDYNDEYNTTSINFIKDVILNMIEENKEVINAYPDNLIYTLTCVALVLHNLNFDDDDIVYIEMDI